MRVLAEGSDNILILDDNISGGKIKLKYRMPTTAEMNGYSNGLLIRKGNKMVRNAGAMRQKYGARLLTGVGEDSFGKLVGKTSVPISSDPGSKNFDPEWKALVVAQAPDVIEILALHIFEASVSKADGEEDQDLVDNDEEDDAAGK